MFIAYFWNSADFLLLFIFIAIRFIYLFNHWFGFLCLEQVIHCVACWVFSAGNILIYHLSLYQVCRNWYLNCPVALWLTQFGILRTRGFFQKNHIHNRMFCNIFRSKFWRNGSFLSAFMQTYILNYNPPRRVAPWSI